MDLKNKAGLALALAAIFTTGGANLAFAADNVTMPKDTLVGGALQKDYTDPSGTVTVPVAALPETAAQKIGGVDVEAAPTLTTTGKNLNVAVLDVNEKLDTLIIEGDITLNGDGGALVTGGGEAIETVVVKGKLTLGDSTGKKESKGGNLTNIIVTGDTTLHGGDYDATGQFTALSDVSVGASGDDVPATFDVETLNMANGKVFIVDPDYGMGVGQAAIKDFAFEGDKTKDYINIGIIAGQNSTLTVGLDNSDWINNVISQVAATGVAFNQWTATGLDNKLSAAFGLVGPQTILGGVGSILVDSAQTDDNHIAAAANSFIAKNNSLTAIDLTGVGGGAKNSAALTVVDSANAFDSANKINVAVGTANTAGNTSTVFLENAASGGKYAIFSNVGTVTIGGQAVGGVSGSNWDYATDSMIFASGLLKGTWSLENIDGQTGTDLVLTVSRDKDVEVQEVFTEMSDGMAGIVDALYGSDAVPGKNATGWGTVAANGNGHTDNAGIWFVSNAIEKLDRDDATAVLEGAAQIAVAGGVPYLTNNIVTRINNLIVDHNDLLNATQPAYGNEPGQLGLWVTPFYGMSDVDGMDAGRFENGFELNYGGAAFGLDYNVNEAFRLGAALNVGGGSSDSEDTGDFSNTENDFDFFGASLYGSYTNGAFGLTGDLGFSGLDSEITQNTPFGNLKSDVDSNVFTLGLTGKYRFVAGENLNVAPHLGLRYTQISMDDAKVNLAGKGTVFNSSIEDMNLFQIPVGIEFSTNTVTDGGWTVTPHADLGVLFTMGDTDVDTRATIPGTTYTGVMNADVVDSAAFTGTLGIKAQADNGLSLGLDYGILASGNQTDHQFTGMLRFEF